MFTTTPALFEGADRGAYDHLEKSVRMARYGTDCYGYCMIAAGHVDLVVEAGLQPYDIVALIPIVEGAGGRVTDWAGGTRGGRRTHRRRRRSAAPRGRAGASCRRLISRPCRG